MEIANDGDEGAFSVRQERDHEARLLRERFQSTQYRRQEENQVKNEEK